MRATIKALAVGFVAVGLMGCPESNNTQEGTAHVGFDTSQGDDADIGADEYKVNFELKNESGRAIYAYSTVEGSICSYQSKDWLSIQLDGQAVRASTDCTMCTCGEEECFLCALDCPESMFNEANSKLADGDARSFEWNGRVWTTDSEEDCEAPELVAGETLEATICYGFEFAMDGEMGSIVDPICETIEFTLDQPEQTVRVVVDEAPSADEYKVNFELKNESGAPIYAYWAVEGAMCSYTPKDWLSIQRDGEAVRTDSDCTLCTCGEEEGCSVCALDCPESDYEESTILLADGDARDYEWDAHIWTTDVEATCESAESAAGETLQAKICYGLEFAVTDGIGAIVDPICEVVEFTIDQPEQTVSVVVSAS